MKVLLISPYKKGLGRQEEHPPVGLGYVATALRKLGHEPDIQDCIINSWGLEEVIEYTKKVKPDIVGVSVFSQAMQNAKDIFDAVKEYNSRIITMIGGPHPSAVPDTTLDYFKSVDYGINGEAEIPLQHLMPYIEKAEGKLNDIPGLIWRENDEYKWNPKVEYKNIDEFGIPAWDLIDPERYYKSPGVDGTAVIHTTRGCPFGCKFCVKLGRILRYRSLENIYNEIKLINSKYGASTFRISDEGFPINPNFAKEFCRYVIKKGDNFDYIAATGLRLNVLDDEMLELMKEAKFARRIGVGIESGVPRVRSLMKKNLSQEQIYGGVNLLKRHGFEPVGNFILGYPGETKEEMNETIKVVLSLKLAGAGFSPFIPLPGSPATKELMSKGEFPKDFDFSKIDLDVILYTSKGISKKDLHNIRRKAVWLFNSQLHMLWYHIHPRRIHWTIIKAARIFLPSKLILKQWRIKEK